MNVVNVAIVGCGLIGAEWDSPATGETHSLTHAAGFSRHPRARLVAMCDQNLERARQAAARWNCPAAFADIESMLAQTTPDLIVVASSSKARLSVVLPALAAGVRNFVIEKPLSTTLAESRDLVAALDAAGAHAIINFSRRWDPVLDDIRRKLASGELGSVQRLIGLYGKGIINNGSHMIDLVSNLCQARPKRVRVLGSPLPCSEADWSHGADTAPDVQIEFLDLQGCRQHLTMLGTDQSAFTCFSLSIIGRDAICDITMGGRQISLTPITQDPNFSGYRVPGGKTEVLARGLESMDRMADEAVRLARGEIAHGSCDAACAMRTALTVDAITQAALQPGAWVEVVAYVD